MKFSTSVSYAIAAVVQIATHNPSRPLANRIICEATGMPQHFVLQMLKQLVKVGVLTSIRGVGGGYTLARPANQITVLDIYESIDRFEGGADVWCEGLMPSSQRVLREISDGIVSDARKRLSNVTIADLEVRT